MLSSITIKSINLFSSWVYKLPKNQECTICRCNLNGQSLYYIDTSFDSEVCTGSCGHSFHSECIKPWVIKNKHCPLCSCVWQYVPCKPVIFIDTTK